MKPMFIVKFKSGGTRGMRANSVEDVIERLTWERTIIGKDYDSLGVLSIEPKDSGQNL